MAKKKRKKIASRGSVNDTILKTLVGGDKYGYEIIKEVEEYSDGKIILKQPSLYSSLTRFEEKGFVSSYWGDSDIGGRRHYYHLTEKGHEYYLSQVQNKDNKNIKPVTAPIDNVVFKQQPTNDLLVNNPTANTVSTQSMPEISIEDNDLPTEVMENQVLEETEMPAIVDFKEVETVPQDILYDHSFHILTPIEEKIDKETIQTVQENNSQNILGQNNISTQIDNTFVSSSNENKLYKSDEDEELWGEIKLSAKTNNKNCAKSPNKRLYFSKRKKAQKVVLDVDGIYKLRDADYVPRKEKQISRIIDNVGKRIPNKNFGYAEYSKPTTPPKELTDEERRIRNENFLNKFNSLTKSRLKPVTPKPEISTEPKVEIDYRSKLDIFNTNDVEEEKQETLNDYNNNTQNNLFNYIEEENDESNNNQNFEITNGHDVVEDEDDKFIDFEPVDFETKSENKKYVEEISNIPHQENVKISRYENKTNAILSDKSYVLINKVKCLFGFLMLLFMIAETTISLFVFKGNGLIFENDKTVFIFAYILSIVVPLGFMLPILFNPNEHKLNSFKLKYAMIFGILTFLISIVLIYCFNSLAGFELDNFKYFAVKLILPIILTFNFIILPPIYGLIIKSKKFYD